MNRMEIDIGRFTARWSGGSFIAVWETRRRNEHVPNHMIELPDNLVKSRATAEDIERIAKDWLEKVSLV